MSRRETDRVIRAAASGRHGVVSRRLLRQSGVEDRAIDRRLADGFLHPVQPGAYAVGRPDLSADGHRLAAVISCERDGGGAWLSYRGASAAFEIHLDRLPGLDVTILRNRGGIQRPAGVRVHHLRTMAPTDVTVRDGVPITTVSRTLVDLAQVLPANELRRAVHEAEVKRLLDRREVASILARMPSRRGAKRLAELLGSSAPDPTNSEFVALYVRLCQRWSLERPETSVYIDAGLGWPTEIDLLYRRQRVIIELDGAHVHMTRQRFEADRRRDAALLALGYVTIRVTWHRLTTDGEALAREIHAVLASRANLAGPG